MKWVRAGARVWLFGILITVVRIALTAIYASAGWPGIVAVFALLVTVAAVLVLICEI